MPIPATVPAAAPAVGELVISWWDDRPVFYGGLPREGVETYARYGTPYTQRTRFCDPGRVAPATTPLAASNDPRLTVVKGRKPHPWLDGPWNLTHPGADAPEWFRTKREALDAGMRRLAIGDHVAAREVRQ